ncbi:hypothetical protein U9M48_040430, partial [Paspalum notatum var. saurae]
TCRRPCRAYLPVQTPQVRTLLVGKRGNRPATLELETWSAAGRATRDRSAATRAWTPSSPPSSPSCRVALSPRPRYSNSSCTPKRWAWIKPHMPTRRMTVKRTLTPQHHML